MLWNKICCFLKQIHRNDLQKFKINHAIPRVRLFLLQAHTRKKKYKQTHSSGSVKQKLMLLLHHDTIIKKNVAPSMCRTIMKIFFLRKMPKHETCIIYKDSCEAD